MVANRRQREWPWVVGVVLSVLPLVWTCRGAPFGVPIGDDYDHLCWLRFHPALNLFGAMGSPWYWRPIGRQAYYAVTAPFMLNAPWLVGLLHGVLLALLGVIVFRIARRLLPPAPAAAAATFVILAEPTRALLISPNGEMLLAILGAALAVHEALHGRLWTSALAALGGLLSHGAAVLVLPALPILSWQRERRLSTTVRWGAASAVVAVVWIAGHALGSARDTLLVASGSLEPSRVVGAIRALALSVAALLNVEDLPEPQTTVFLLGTALVFAVSAAILWMDRRALRRAAALGPGMLACVGWFLTGAALLAVLTDWNAWRTTLTGLWLGIALFGFLWSVRPWLAAVFFAIRLMALLSAAPAPAMASEAAPATTSAFGFTRLVRLQQMVDASRRALLARYPVLPPGAAIRYWSRPAMIELGFAGSKAFEVWYGDSTVTWGWLWEPGEIDRRVDAVVVFESRGTHNAAVLDPLALSLVRRGSAAFRANRFDVADSLFDAAWRAQSPATPTFTAWTIRQKARAALNRHQWTRADSLNREDYRLAGETPSYDATAAALALVRQDLPLARELARRALATEPRDALARVVIQRLEARAIGGPTVAAADSS